MPTGKSAIRVYVTDEQMKAAKKLASVQEHKSVSALVLSLLKSACEQAGIEWQDDNSGWGGNRRDDSF